MNPGSSALTSLFRRFGIRQLAVWHPEWWVLAISAGAWCCLLFPHGHAGSCVFCKVNAPGSGWPDLPEWIGGLRDWFIMILAMMLPLMIIPVRVAAFGSLWRRRHWAIGAFLASYLTVWIVAGATSLLLMSLLHVAHATECRWVIGVGFLAAAAWHITALKRRFSAACHLTKPLAPDGWPAHRDCLRFGANHGVHCVGNCGVLMFAAMLSPWHQTMMFVATLLLLYERYRARRGSRAIPLTLCLLGVGHCIY
jgi:predicted metal-binding membrane protein